MNNKNCVEVSNCTSLIASLLLVGLSAPAGAQLSGGEVHAGEGSIDTNGNTTTITQRSQNLVVDWDTFNVAANERVVFDQPNVTSAALNRIFDQNPSQIFGAIDANGRVFLFNPNGLLFGASAKVSVASLVASSLDLSVDDFMAGQYDFNAIADRTGGLVVNRGLLQAATGGSVALIGGAVENEGVILAEFGDVAMGAGNKVSLDFDGDGLLFFEVTGDVLTNADGRESAVSNSGEIGADGGQVVLAGSTARNVFSNVVNNSGIVRAQRIENTGGVIRLSGSGGDVYSSGTLNASGTGGDGGSVQVLGDRVALTGNASISASGDAAGGEILVGGDYQGANPDIANASATYVGAGATLSADGGSGDGGTVIVWSDELTQHNGHVSASSASGAGGFAEVSGKDTLIYRGTSDLSGPAGNGTLLLDPRNVEIAAADANLDGVGTEADPFRSDGAAGAATLSAATLATALDGANVHVTTTNTPSAEPDDVGNITVNSAVTAPAAGGDLTLEAENDIILNAAIDFATNSSAGDLALYADSDGTAAGNEGDGTGAISGIGVISMGTGDLQLRAGSGVGTSGSPIATTGVTDLAAETETGGVFVSNTGGSALNVGSATTNIAGTTTGIDVSASGDVSISNVGGSVTLTEAISTASGSVTVTADSIEGDAGNTAADVSASAVVLSAQTGIGATNAIETATQSITATNAVSGDIDIDNTSASAVTVASLATLDGGNIDFGNSGGGTVDFQSVDASGEDGDPVDGEGDVTLVNADGITVSGSVSAGTTEGDVSVTAAAGNIVLGAVSAGNEASISANAGNITDGNAGAVNVTAGELLMSAQSGIGTITDFDTGTGDAIEVDVDLISPVSTTDAGGDINLDVGATSPNFGTSAITPGSGTAADAIVQSSTNLTVDNAAAFVGSTGDNLGLVAGQTLTLASPGVNYPGTNVRLSGGTDVVLSGGGRTIAVTADSLDFESGGGTGGLTTTLNTNVDTIDANLTNTVGTVSSLIINEGNGIELVNVVAPDGAITVNVTDGNVTATSVAAQTDSDANDVTITTTNGDIIVGSIAATGAGDVILNASANITDGDLDAAVDVSGDLGDFTAGGAIGATGANGSIDTALNSLNASGNGVAGGVYVLEDDAIDLVDVDTVDADIVIESSGVLTATVVDGGGAARSVTLTSSGGNVLLGVVNGAGAVDISADAGSILDNNGTDVNITGGSLDLSALVDIGSITDFEAGTGDPIELGAVGTLTNASTATAATAGTPRGINIELRDPTTTVSSGALDPGGAGFSAIAILQSPDDLAFDLDAISTSAGDSAGLFAGTDGTGTLTIPGAGINEPSLNLLLRGATDVIDDDGGAAARELDITASSLAVVSGAAGGNTTINTTVGRVSVDLQNPGNLVINETNGAVLGTLATNSGTIDVTSATGDLIVEVVNAGGGADNVTLIASAGAISDPDTGADDVLSSVTGDLVTLTSATGVGGSGLPINTTAGSLSAAATASGGIYVAETNALSATSATIGAGSGDIEIIVADGNLEVDTIDANGGLGDVTLEATLGDIRDIDANSDVIANEASLTAATGIGVAGGNPINTTIDFLDAATGSGGIDINEETDDIDLNTVTAGSGTVRVVATGAITDTDTNSNVTADTVNLQAANGIGGADTINLAATSISASNSTAGAINLANTGGVAAVNVTSVTNDGANTDITNTGSGGVTFDTVTAPGNVGLTSSGGSLVVGANVASAAGNVSLETVTAGDISLGGTTTANAGSVVITAAGAVSGGGQVTAGTSATLTAQSSDGVNITVTSGQATQTVDGYLELGRVIADTVQLTSLNAAIVDATANSGDAILANSAVLNAELGIGDDSANNFSSGPIRTDVLDIVATTDGAGDIVIDQGATNIELTDIQATNGLITVTADGAIDAVNLVSITDDDANGIELSTTDGDIEVGIIIAGGVAGDVTLSTDDGSITDDVDSPAINPDRITADELTLTATGNIALANIGSPVNPINTDVNSLNASSAGLGNIYLTEENEIVLLDVGTTDGSIDITAGNQITAQNVQSLTGIDTNDVILTANAGDLILGTVSAAGEADVNLTALAGDITSAGSAVSANEVEMNASGGIGVNGDGPINTTTNITASTGFLSATTTGNDALGDINIAETNALDTDDVDINTNGTGAQSVSLSAQAFTVGGSDFGDAGDNLSLTADTGAIEGGAGRLLANELTLIANDSDSGAIGDGTAVLTTATTLTAQTTGNATISELDGLDVASANVGGNLALSVNQSDPDPTGNLTDSGAVTVTGVTTLAARGGDILLNDPGNDFSSVVVESSNNALIVDANDLAVAIDAEIDVEIVSGGNATLNAISANTGSLDVAAAGNIVQGTGAISVATTTDMSAGTGNAITLGNTANTLTQTVTVDSLNNAVTIGNQGDLTIAANQAVASLDLTSANGSVLQATALTVTGTAIAQAATDVDLSTAGNSFGSVNANATAGDAAIGGAIGGDASASAGGNATVSGAIGGSVALTAGLDATVTDSTALDLAASTVGGNLAATSNGGDITDSGDIAVTGDSTFTASQAGSSIVLDSAGNNFGGSVTFLPDDGSLANVTVVDNSALELQNGLDLSGNLDVTANGVSQAAGGVAVAGTTDIDAGANAITLADANNDFSGTVTLSNSGANDVSIANQGGLELGQSAVGSGALTVAAAGGISQTGAITQEAAAGNASFTDSAGDVNLGNAANDFTGDVLVDAAGLAVVTDANDLAGHGTAVGDFTATALSGNLSTSTVAGAEVNLTAAGNIAQTGGTTATAGDINLSAGGDINAGDANAAAGNYVADAGGGITLAGDVAAANGIDVDAAGPVGLAGNLSSTSGGVDIASGGSVIQAGNILTEGGLIAINAVNGIGMDADARSDSSGGDISYVSTGNGDILIGLLNSGSDGAVTGDALGVPVDAAQSGDVFVTSGSSVLSASPIGSVNVRGASTELTARGGTVGSTEVPLTLNLPLIPGVPTITILATQGSAFFNPNLAEANDTSGDASAAANKQATAASVQSAVEAIGFIDWAGLDPDVRLVDCLEPCLKLPADQLEDDGMSQLRAPNKMLVIRTANGVRLIPVYTRAEATIAGNWADVGHIRRN